MHSLCNGDILLLELEVKLSCLNVREILGPYMPKAHKIQY